MLKGVGDTVQTGIVLPDGVDLSGGLIKPAKVELILPDQPQFPTGELILPKGTGTLILDEQSVDAALLAIRAGATEKAVLAAATGAKARMK